MNNTNVDTITVPIDPNMKSQTFNVRFVLSGTLSAIEWSLKANIYGARELAVTDKGNTTRSRLKKATLKNRPFIT